MDYEKAYKASLKTAAQWIKDGCTDKEKICLKCVFPELRESEDENLKNKSGYYKAGKFWKASTLWNAVKDKTPQRVPNRYILQECTWNIGTLQRFADEIKNVQEVSLDYPIILDMNGNILDGAHRVVKAYLEGKDIDIVYLGDDEWPEPDYDEEKAVKESEDERIRMKLFHTVRGTPKDNEWFEEISKEAMLAWLEKQKENPKSADSIPEYCASNARCPYKIYGDEDFIGDIKDTPAYHFGFDEGVRSEREKQKEQKPIQTSEEKEYVRTLKSLISDFIRDKQPEDVVYYQRVYDWLDGRQIEQKPELCDFGRWDEESYNNGIHHVLQNPETYGLTKQKPAEWSEEDERKRLACIETINEVIDYERERWEDYNPGKPYRPIMKYDEQVDWLKSLRPSWRPSEEQMSMLRAVINDPNNAGAESCYMALKSIYNNLNKLM